MKTLDDTKSLQDEKIKYLEAQVLNREKEIKRLSSLMDGKEEKNYNK